jgi:chromosome segregation ATPase
MAFFQKASPADLIEADLNASRKKRRDTEQRLQYAETQLAEYQATVKKLTNDVADNSAVAAASASVAGAEVEVKAWQKSLADINEKILDLEDAEKEIADQKLRAETAAAIRVIRQENIDDGAALNIAIEKRIKSARRAGDLIPESLGIVNYLMNAKTELPARGRTDRATLGSPRRCNDCKNGTGCISNARADRGKAKDCAASSDNGAIFLVEKSGLV